MSGRARDSLRAALVLTPGFLVGAVLRLWRLDAQVLGGDEFHTLRASLEQPVSQLLVTYQLSDVCLPLAAFFRVLIDSGVSLSEWHLRAPSVLAGLALLAWAPWSLRTRIGARAAVVLGWLLAVSPLLFFYSRIARSYALLALLAFAAIQVFERWWSGRRPQHAVAYIVLAALALYVHPAAGPFVVAPFLYALGTLVREPERRWRGLGALAGIGVGLLCVAALFLVPAAESLRRVVEFNFALRGIAESPYPPPSLVTSLAGTHSAILALLFFAIAARGLTHLWGGERGERFGPYSCVCVAGGLGGLALLISPMLPRYAIACLPILLVWVAVGLTAPVPRPLRIPALAAASAFAVALVASGPFSLPGFFGSAFMHHNDYVEFARTGDPAPASELPEIYRQLSAPGPLIEYPWLASWEASRAVRVYQVLHGREVRVSGALDWLDDDRLALRNALRATPEAMLASSARHLVLHLDLGAEEEAVAPASRVQTEAIRQGVARRARRDAGLANRLRREWGAPHFTTPTHLAWDLERVRQGDR